MAAPLYFQHEIQTMLAMEKRVLRGSWKELTEAQKAKAKQRANRYEETTTMEVVPLIDSDITSFAIFTCKNLRGDDFSIMLYGRMKPRPSTPICRYDVQDIPHENPEWFPPPFVASGVFHRHVYNERAIREGDLKSWCDCAEVLDVLVGGSPQTQLDRLKSKFISDLKLSFEDPHDRSLFVENHK